MRLAATLQTFGSIPTADSKLEDDHMCVVSMIGEHYHGKWGPQVIPMTPGVIPAEPIRKTPTPDEYQNLQRIWTTPVTRQEFDALKREVQEMKKLLERAHEYDKRTGQEDCHVDEKMATLRRIAEAVGIDIDEVLKK